MSVYVKLACPEPKTFRGTNLLLTATFVAWRITLVTAAGLISLQLLVEAAVLVPLSVAAGWMGARYATQISAQIFFRLVRIVLLLASVALTGKGVAQIW